MSRAYSGPIPVHSSPNTINDSYDVPVGCILWLPKKDDIDRHSVGADIGDGCFNHPVVVLSVDLVEKKAIILIVSVLISNCPKLLTCSPG